MNNFISLLDTTLKMNKEDDKSEEDDEVRESKSHRRLMEPASRPAESEIHRSASLPSKCLKKHYLIYFIILIFFFSRTECSREHFKIHLVKFLYMYYILLFLHVSIYVNCSHFLLTEYVTQSIEKYQWLYFLFRFCMFFLGVETLCNADRLTMRIQILHTYVLYKH